jgi:hypothetical protein
VAVANHIDGQDSGKPALGAFFGHELPLRLKTPMEQIVVEIP